MSDFETHPAQMPAYRSDRTKLAWPWPGDTELQRARRLANTLLYDLHKVAPEQAEARLAEVHAMGQTWLGWSTITHELDEWVDPGTAAQVGQVAVATIRQWRKRGKLTGVEEDNGWRYRVGDVLAAAAAARLRRAKAA